MTYGPGFGLPGLTSPTSEVRKAVEDLRAMPSEPFKDGQLVMLETMLEGRLADEAAGISTGPFTAPAT
jgi:hypothetical protein